MPPRAAGPERDGRLHPPPPVQGRLERRAQLRARRLRGDPSLDGRHPAAHQPAVQPVDAVALPVVAGEDRCGRRGHHRAGPARRDRRHVGAAAARFGTGAAASAPKASATPAPAPAVPVLREAVEPPRPPAPRKAKPSAPTPPPAAVDVDLDVDVGEAPGAAQPALAAAAQRRGIAPAAVRGRRAGRAREGRGADACARGPARTAGDAAGALLCEQRLRAASRHVRRPRRRRPAGQPGHRRRHLRRPAPPS